jgi:hypothetical protein
MYVAGIYGATREICTFIKLLLHKTRSYAHIMNVPLYACPSNFVACADFSKTYKSKRVKSLYFADTGIPLLIVLYKSYSYLDESPKSKRYL